MINNYNYMINIINNPGQYSASQSPIRYTLNSDAYIVGDNFNYLTSIIKNEQIVNAIDVYNDDDNILTYKFTMPSTEDFEIGERIYLESGGSYDDIYTIIRILSPTELILDLVVGSGFDIFPTLYSTIDYKLTPTPDGLSEVDLLSVLKDYVSSDDFIPEDFFIPANSTRFEYKVSFGEEYKYKFYFDDNNFLSGGAVGFINNSLSVQYLEEIPFYVGDRVKVQQNYTSLNYSDNFYDGDSVGFWTDEPYSADELNRFTAGSELIVTGQKSNKNYNGSALIDRFLDNQELTTLSNIVGVTVLSAVVLQKSWESTTPVESGIIYGHINTQYNDVIKINDIYHDGTFTIKMDMGWGVPTNPVSGYMEFANGRITKLKNQVEVNDLVVFDSKFNIEDYVEIDNMEEYILQDVENGGVEKFISTASRLSMHRIEPKGKSWLLAHAKNKDIIEGVRYTFKLNSGISQDSIYMLDVGNREKDWYIPSGLGNIININDIGDLVTTGLAFNDFVDEIKSYEVTVIQVDGNNLTNTLSFPVEYIINDDCSQYEKYSIIYKDKLGSYMPIPMIYKADTGYEVERQEYKQNDFSYGTNDYDRQLKNFYTKSRDKITLRSGFLNDYENDLYKDMITSNDVYLQDGEKITPIIVTEDDFETRDNKRDKLFRYDVDVQIARDEIRY